MKYVYMGDVAPDAVLADMVEEEEEKEASNEDKELEKIENSGLMYNGSYIKHQPWADTAGVYCIKPDVYIDCGKDEVKIGFTGGESERGTLKGRMASYATSFVDFRILFVICYESHSKASAAEAEMKRWLGAQGSDARLHQSGYKSEWYEFNQELIPELIRHMYGLASKGVDGATKDVISGALAMDEVVWAYWQDEGEDVGSWYPASIDEIREGNVELEEYAEEVDTGEMYLVKFFDGSKEYLSTHEVIDAENVIPWHEGADLGYMEVADPTQVKKALAYIKRNLISDKGRKKVEPFMGYNFSNDSIKMTDQTHPDMSKYFIGSDGKNKFISAGGPDGKRERRLRYAKNRAKRSHDREATEESEAALMAARAAYNTFTYERTGAAGQQDDPIDDIASMEVMESYDDHDDFDDSPPDDIDVAPSTGGFGGIIGSIFGAVGRLGRSNPFKIRRRSVV